MPSPKNGEKLSALCLRHRLRAAFEARTSIKLPLSSIEIDLEGRASYSSETCPEARR
jgi:hypothetical protein